MPEKKANSITETIKVKSKILTSTEKATNKLSIIITQNIKFTTSPITMIISTSSPNENTASSINPTQTVGVTDTTKNNPFISRTAELPTIITLPNEPSCCGTFSKEGGQYANGIFIKQILKSKVAYVFDMFAIWYESASQYWIAGLLSDCVEGHFRGFNIAKDPETICPVNANWMKYDDEKWTKDNEMQLTCIDKQKSVENDIYTTQLIRY